MKLNELRNIRNADSVNIYLNTKNYYFIKTSETYEFLSNESLIMWDIYGEHEIKEMYVEDDMLIIDINQI